ncbi:MAG: hypothetical protein JWP74_644 [Marmoricola sp.]|nr:hypothetical protein [Marmoricola sp.]
MAGNGPDDGRSRKERADAIRDAQARKQRTLTLTIGTVTAVIVIVLGLIVAKSISSSPAAKADPSETSGLISSTLASEIKSVPASVFDSVGVGSASNGPKAVSGGSAMTADGKPRILYVGSEYCPYCAAERWGLAVALSRFGTFTNLGKTASSATDLDKNTNTLTFHGATYTSQYFSFTGYEQQNRTRTKTVDTLTTADNALVTKYDNGGSIPFIDLGGLFIGSGASYDPATLAGMTHAQIGAALSDPSSAAAKGIIGTANLYTAALCKLTNGQPATVCSSSGVSAGAAAAELG